MGEAVGEALGDADGDADGVLVAGTVRCKVVSAPVRSVKLLDQLIYILYGRHLDCSFPSVPCDHPKLFTGVRGRGVLRSSGA